jgi:hypothetical protein
MTLLIQLVSGAVGGNVGGLLNKARSLGNVKPAMGPARVLSADEGRRPQRG